MSEKGHNCNLCKKTKYFLPIGNVCFGEKYLGKIIQENDAICDEYELGGFIELSERLAKIPEIRQVEIDRMSISEQVKELRKMSQQYPVNIDIDLFERTLNQAADTIESLSAKLQAANEELERWHTDRINEKIKNPFAWTSTLICHNCDHKDEYIEELEAANTERSAAEEKVWRYCKECEHYTPLPNGVRGGKRGHCEKRYPRDSRRGCVRACKMFSEKDNMNEP